MKFKSNSKQRIKVIQGLRSFKNTLPTKVKKIINKKGQIYSKTLENWKKIVGDELFKVCYPKSIKSSNSMRKSSLSIMVQRGHEVDLEYSRSLIINKMNLFFGYNVIESIKISTFENENNKIKGKNILNLKRNEHLKKISYIKNEKIKNSLMELGKLIKQK
tara:strand:- start:1191 stop:1673 length:483 start_codon:yes stop_codon:yes gene_type:complete